MEFCPVCKSEIKDNQSNCSVCGSELSEKKDSAWICIGSIEDKISADFAEETLKSNQIPVVVISNSGFFGAAGLPLNSLYGHTSALFDLSVPEEYEEDATEILTMILGEKWIKKEC